MASAKGSPATVSAISGPLHCIDAPAPDCPVHVVAARVRSARQEDGTVRFASGWGASPGDAARNCLFEAAERYSAQFFGTESILRRCADALGDDAVRPPDMLLISDAQYAGRREWNRLHPGFNEVPARWREDRPVDWIAPSIELSSTEAWLPAGLCLLGHASDQEAGLPPADSNGIAAGYSIEDAAVRAFVELVERDAVAIWWYNQTIRPLLDLAQLAEPLVGAYAMWCKTRGRFLRLHDLTHDLGIPVVAAVCSDADGTSVALGFGAGSSAGHAARQAVGELAQFECNVAFVERRMAARGAAGLTPEAGGLLKWVHTSRLWEHDHLVGANERVPPAKGVNLSLSACRELCTKHGLQLLALDLTRPWPGLPVARVVVPGLRSMWARFAAGRLYEVPVRLGWRRTPATTVELNPMPLMF